MGGFDPAGAPNTVHHPLGLVTTPQNTFVPDAVIFCLEIATNSCWQSCIFSGLLQAQGSKRRPPLQKILLGFFMQEREEVSSEQTETACWHPFVAWAKKGCRETEPRTSFVKHHHLQKGMQRREKLKKIYMLNNICLRGHQSFSDWFYP